MIRDYKAYNKKTKEVEPVLLICFVNRYVDVLPERNLEGGSQESWEFDDIELMEWTGFKDKRGKKIYDGDIFRIEESGDGVDEQDKIFYLVVTWVKEWGMFCTLLADGEYTKYLQSGVQELDEPLFWTYTLEDTDSKKHFLCGNIYQNKNLIE